MSFQVTLGLPRRLLDSGLEFRMSYLNYLKNSCRGVDSLETLTHLLDIYHKKVEYMVVRDTFKILG